MVGLLVASPEQMKAVQEDGAKNVLRVAQECGVKRKVLISAIGADKHGVTP
jgi:NADH dehydrogenase